MFSGLAFCFSGTLSMLRRDYEALVKKNGANVTSSVTGSTTHLVTTSSEYETETAKIARAKSLDIWIVEEDFIQESLKKKKLVKEKDFCFEEPEGDDDDDEEEEEKEEEEVKKPVQRVSTTIVKKRSRKKKEEDETEEEQKEEQEEERPTKMKKVVVKGKAAVDEDSGYTDDGIVYEDKAAVWSIMLNQTDVAYGAYGHNKYYLIQIIQVGKKFIVFNKVKKRNLNF